MGHRSGGDLSFFVSSISVRPPPPVTHQHVAFPTRASTTTNSNYCTTSAPTLFAVFANSRRCKHHHQHGSKLFQSEEYLNGISDGGEGFNYGNSTLNGDVPEQDTEEEYEDDDYAMSIPKPVRSSEYFLDKDMGSNIIFSEDVNGDVTVHPNEEPPEEQESGNNGVQSEASTIYEDGVKSSKFDSLSTITSTGTSAVASEEVNEHNKSVKNNDNTAKNNEDNDGTNINQSTEGSIKSLIQNLLGGDKSTKSREVKERERRWSEWMRSGRKSREESSETSDMALDEALLSVDKGADYVVVAVPAEAAAGVGPVLPSFPGGKLFQNTVRKTLQQEVSFGNGDFGGDSKNSTSAPRSATISLKPSEKKKKKKKDSTKKERMKRPTLSIETNTRKQQQQEAKTQKRNLQQQERHRQRQRQLTRRDPSRISANDWRHNLVNLPNSTILRDVRGPVAWVFVWATLWSGLHKLLMNGSTASSPKWIRTTTWLVCKMCLPTVQHTMMVSAMSFLLVFRTNSAYQRFAEGRKIWNDIVDATRDFSRMLKLYEFAIGSAKRRRIDGLLASFPYLLRHRIRPSLMSGMIRVNDAEVERDPEHSLLLYPDESLRDTDPEAAARAYDEEETGSSRRKTRELCWVDRRTLPWKLIPGSALELCARAQNRPLWVCDRMAKELAVVEDLTPWFTNRERLAMIGYVDKLSRSIGACERIHQTVVPLNYARHALRSLTVWLWTLPFVLVKDLGLLTGPVVGILSWILYGVYEIGSRIEDPFQGTLRLSIYCDAIRRDVLADAIARDTAFNLEEEKKYTGGEDAYEDDAIFESESEEYDGDDISAAKKKKGDFFESLGVLKL